MKTKNILIFGDLHIKEKEIEEIELVISEIIDISIQRNIEEVWCLGDTLDRVIPTPKELEILANFFIALNKPIKMVVAKSHESIAKEENYLNHISIIYPKLQIGNEWQVSLSQTQKAFLGHFMLQESKFGYKERRIAKEFSEYKYVFLGHQHSFQYIKPNIYHVGSCRYIRAEEAKDEKKFVGVLEISDYDKCLEWIDLKSPYPLKEFIFNKDIFKDLDKLNSKTKVRVILNSFEDFKQFINKQDLYKEKFFNFKIKNDFVNTIKLKEDNRDLQSFKKELKFWMEENNIENEIQKIILIEVEK